MSKQQFNTEKLIAGCARLGIDLAEAQAHKMQRQIGLLLKWNRHLNLTAITSMDQIIEQHLLDSLAIEPYVQGQSLIDIGSGGGFPGIPLAIVHPEWQVTLLDSRGKRVEFLRNSCVNLALNNVALVKQRIEDYRPAVKFDTLATRAFASLADTVKLTATLQHGGCRLLAMKGRLPSKEIESLDPTIRDRTTIEVLNVPFLGAERHLVIIEF